MTDEPTVIRHVLVHGRVQGVGFRAFSEDSARAFGLGGWVRNRRDGTVELLLCGPASRVRQMIESCRRGPPGSRVDNLRVRPAEPDLLGKGSSEFLVLPTA